MNSYRCPVCDTELQRHVHLVTNTVELFCSCCEQMNDGIEATDFVRALFVLQTIADAMHPDERERIRREVEVAEERRKEKTL